MDTTNLRVTWLLRALALGTEGLGFDSWLPYLLASYVALNKLQNLSEPLFYHV